MKRDPSIHITRSQMIEALKNIDINKPTKVWVTELFKMVGVKSVNHRSVTITNDKLLKKSEKLKSSQRGEASLFSELLFLKRKQLRHKGIKMIIPGQPEWLALKEITQLATEFCNEFGLKIKEGYKIYAELGLNRMGNKYYLNKFKTYHPLILNEYDALQVIRTDPTPSLTKSIHDLYISIIASKIGFSQGYKDNPEKYKFFVEVKNMCKEMGISPKIFLTAQFAALEFVNGVPEPQHLVGTRGKERLQKYLYENNIKVENNKPRVIDFSKIKKK